MSTSSPLENFLSQLAQCLERSTLQRMVLSRYQGHDPQLLRQTARLLTLKDVQVLNVVTENKTFDSTQNIAISDAVSFVAAALAQDFASAHLTYLETQRQVSNKVEVQLTRSKKGKWLVNRSKTALSQAPAPVIETHNREKHRLLAPESPFLQALGITDHRSQIIPSMQKKWKQINKFIEVFAGAIRQTNLLEKPQITVADFGCGKAYLTFAMHHYLQQLQCNSQVIGVELRQSLVDLCNGIAARLELEQLQFEQGDVQHFAARGIDVMIALHACDIATDHAIHMGIAVGAEIIMCSPCCHKELRPQLQPPKVLSPLLIHGIHAAQQAEMLTDGLRALLLEAHGYDTQVFEFISLEHTSKNKMILATKRKKPQDSQPILGQIAALKAEFGIKHQRLEQLLNSTSS